VVVEDVGGVLGGDGLRLRGDVVLAEDGNAAAPAVMIFRAVLRLFI